MRSGNDDLVETSFEPEKRFPSRPVDRGLLDSSFSAHKKVMGRGSVARLVANDRTFNLFPIPENAHASLSLFLSLSLVFSLLFSLDRQDALEDSTARRAIDIPSR